MPQDTFPLYDRIVGGTLGETLLTWQEEKVSLMQMAFRLSKQHDIEVAPETIRRWLTQLDKAVS